MRATFLFGWGILIGLMGAVTPLVAHHGGYGWDKTKRITIAGVITEVEWVYPHTYLYVEVKDENGTLENWAVECSPSQTLSRAGWKRPDAGTTISILAYGPLSRMALLSKIRSPAAARERLQSNHYVAGGCATTGSTHLPLGYGPPCQ